MRRSGNVASGGVWECSGSRGAHLLFILLD
jgi:hypothetical protein